MATIGDSHVKKKACPHPLATALGFLAVTLAPAMHATEPKQDEVIENSIKMKLVYIAPGKFEMGAPKEENHSGDGGVETLRQVTLTNGFYLGAFEVTQSEFQQVLDRNPAQHSKDGKCASDVEGQDTSKFPVENVTWFDAVEFCNALSKRENLTEYYTLDEVKRDDGAIKSGKVTVKGGLGYRLPTEAEWEYACRAGTKTPFHFGEKLDGDEANIKGKAVYLFRTCPVGSYAPNKLGLYDMHGNVMEWCHDWFEDKEGDAVDPQGPDSGEARILRGGGFYNGARNCRCAARPYTQPDYRGPNAGLRVARTFH